MQFKTAADLVGALSKMDLRGNLSARKPIQCRKESFTWLAEIDELLTKVNLLPPYVSQLELARDEKRLPRKRRREALEEKCEKIFKVHASNLIDIMGRSSEDLQGAREQSNRYRGAIIRHTQAHFPQAHYFELACELSFVRKRGSPELVRTVVQYLPSCHGTHESDSMLGALVEHNITRAPLLCEYEDIFYGAKRLRGMKDASYLTPAEVNYRGRKSAELLARKLF